MCYKTDKILEFVFQNTNITDHSVEVNAKADGDPICWFLSWVNEVPGDWCVPQSIPKLWWTICLLDQRGYRTPDGGLYPGYKSMKRKVNTRRHDPCASRGHSTVTKFLKEKQQLRHCTRLSVKPYMWATDTLDRIVTEPSQLSIKKVPVTQMFLGEAIQVYPRCNLTSGLAVSLFLADICALWLWPYSTVPLVVSTVNKFLTKSVRLQHRSWPASPPPPRLSGRAIMMNECVVERRERWGGSRACAVVRGGTRDMMYAE